MFLLMQHITERYRELQTFENRDLWGRPPTLNCLQKGNFMSSVEDDPPIISRQQASDLKVDYCIKDTPQKVRKVILKNCNERPARNKFLRHKKASRV